MTVPFDPDAALMLRVKRGDVAAFGELMDRHQRSVLNLIYRYVGDAVEAEDLAQDAFLKIYQARQQYKPVAKFRTWMYRIVVNTCLNAIRQKRPSPALPDSDLLQGHEDDHPTRQIRKKELEEVVKQAMQTLPENQRLAVILTQFEDRSYEESAEILGVSVPALKSLIVRAKENLSQRLGRWME